MKKSDATKDQYLKAMAAHVLAHGLSTASLRPLAKAAGTSDHMLIYHFGSKDALIAALLAHIAGEFMTLLNEALPPGRAETRKACLGEIIAILRVDPAADSPAVSKRKKTLPAANKTSAAAEGEDNQADSTSVNESELRITDHARDLIDRLSEWSHRLERREASLDARERELVLRQRMLRRWESAD